jgi:hypothetical protein
MLGFAESLARLALGKEFFLKKRKIFAESLARLALGKKVFF